MEKPSIYLAGPEVFLKNAAAVGQAKKALCQQYGFIGLFPLDAELPQQLQGKTGSAQHLGFAISQGNENLIRQADLLIANLTPFRSPSADVGTTYELGFARGLGKPIHGYSHQAKAYQQRIWHMFPPKQPEDQQAGQWRDGLGYKIEEFELRDNLMLEGGIYQAKGHFICQNTIDLEDLTAFEQVLKHLADEMLRR